MAKTTDCLKRYVRCHATHLRSRRRFVLLLSLLPAMTGVHAQSIEGLGRATAFSVSEDGRFVVGSAGNSWLWEEGGETTEIDGQLQDLSADASVAAGSVSRSEYDFEPRAAIWTAEGGWEILETEWYSFAYGVSDDGTVVVGQRRETDPEDNTDTFKAVSWRPDFLDHGEGAALAVSGDGTKVVGSFSGGAPVAGGQAWNTSGDGSIIVGEQNGSAFRWTESEGTEILGPGRARAVSDSGVVVGEDLFSDSTPTAMMTAEDGTWRRLADVLEEEHGLDLTGWTLRDAWDITPDGRVIVGNGFAPDGTYQGYRVVLTSSVMDLRFSAGQIREDPFEGIAAELSRNGAHLEMKLTDSDGAYSFSNAEEEDGYELRLRDTEIWSIQRAWRGLSRGQLYKSARIPATMMSQLDALTDTLASRDYDETAVRDLFRAFDHWADTTFTDQAEVDTSLARLIITHEAVKAMYDNTVPVSKELATALAELAGFAISTAQAMKTINSTRYNQNLPFSSALKFQNSAQIFAATMIFNMITKPILAAMPSSPPALKTALVEAHAVVLSQMQAQLNGKGLSASGLLKSAAVRTGAAVGDDVLMTVFASITQEDLDRAAATADAFNYTGETKASWDAMRQAANENFTESDDAASFSALTRGTATGIEGISGLAGGFLRTVRLAQLLRVAQLAGYLAAITRTSWQFYDTAENDLPHAIDLAFDPSATPGDGAPNRLLDPAPHAIARGTGYRALEASSEELEQAISGYRLAVDELVAGAQGGDEAAFIERLMALVDAADVVATAIARAHLPILAVTRDANQQIENFPAAHTAMLDAVIGGATHHLALSAYALGYLGEEATADELVAQADTVKSAFAAVLPQLDAVSALVAELPVPAFVAVTRHELSADSVEAAVPFTLRATVRNGGGAAAEGVVVTLVPDDNMDVEGPAALELGALGTGEERELTWTVAAHDTATSSAYQIRIEAANGEGLPFAASYGVAGATGVRAEPRDRTTLPGGITLSQNYPNPFNPSTTIRYELPVAGHVELTVYDVFGRAVRTLVEGRQDAGRHEATFQAEGLASGVYFCRLRSAGAEVVRSMLLVR